MHVQKGIILLHLLLLLLHLLLMVLLLLKKVLLLQEVVLLMLLMVIDSRSWARSGTDGEHDHFLGIRVVVDWLLMNAY